MIPVEAERTRQKTAQVLCRVLLALTLAATAACTERPSYSSLTPGAEPLRTRFNQDAGKVRIIMLPAPT